MAKEVATAVTDGYLSLKPTVALVRDALNSHIGKGRAERESRQKGGLVHRDRGRCEGGSQRCRGDIGIRACYR